MMNAHPHYYNVVIYFFNSGALIWYKLRQLKIATK